MVWYKKSLLSNCQKSLPLRLVCKGIIRHTPNIVAGYFHCMVTKRSLNYDVFVLLSSTIQYQHVSNCESQASAIWTSSAWRVIFNNNKQVSKLKFKNFFYKILFVWTRCCMLCVCHTTPTQKLFCLHFFRQAGTLQRVDYLVLGWEKH